MDRIIYLSGIEYYKKLFEDSTSKPSKVIKYCDNKSFIFHLIPIVYFIDNRSRYIESIHVDGFKSFWVLFEIKDNRAIFLHEDLGIMISVDIKESIYVHDRHFISFMCDQFLLDITDRQIVSMEDDSKNVIAVRIERNCYTYMMLNERNGYIKIGISNNPSYRENTLQSQEPEVKLLWKSKIDIEAQLHYKFRDKRIRGEWFNLEPEDIKWIIDNCSDTIKLNNRRK
jgi:hypothetical protein